MSWINSRQHGPSMPPTTATTAPPSTPQSGSVGFGGGVQQQDWQQNYGHLQHQYPPHQSQIPNNFYNSAPATQQNWQQSQSFQQTQSQNNQFFNNQPPVVDNYVQQLLMPPPQTISQKYQQLPQPPQSQQLPYQQPLSTSNVPNPNINQQSFLKTDQPIGMNPANVQQNETQSQNEGWGDWDWNDNNQSLHGHAEQQNIPIVPQSNALAESFSTEQMDNWKWNSEENNSNIIQASDIVQSQLISNEPQQSVDHFDPSSLGILASPTLEEQSLKQTRPPSVGLAAPATVPTPFSQSANLVQPLQQSSPMQLDSSGNTVSNNVYVSQAKPVAQPARQYAKTPSVTPQQGTPSNVMSSINQSDLSPPSSQTRSQQNASPAGLLSMAPPPPIIQASSAPPISSNVLTNPYKRSGAAQHHRTAMASTKPQHSNVMPTQFYGQTPGDYQQLQNNVGNQEFLAPDNSEIIPDKNFEVENLEVAPSNDRNQYLQTGHLSEEGYNNVELAQELNELDNFPPPGLSRLVLGQPEIENTQSNSISQPDIPPGLDRMVPGTELVTAGINMERQADGQDTIPAPRSAFTNVPVVQENDPSANIDITTDRNLYFVPGESDAHEQRIVTGLENDSNQDGEQREVELDGENLEDQQIQQQQHQHFPGDLEITRDEPIEGANTLDPVPSPSVNHETESSLTIETNQKDVSNPSTCNDDSDHKIRHPSYYGKANSRRQDDKKRRPITSDIKDRKERYDSEESDYSSDRERRRYREGSVRNDRDKDRESKERDRREKREGSARDRDRYRDEKDRDGRRYDRDRQRDKYERDRDRGRQNNSRYETDSKYETESSTRYERRRGDRDRNEHDYRRDEKEKRYRRDRHDRDERDYRRRDTDRDYRDRRRDPREKNRAGSGNDYDDDYRRTTGSRSVRDNDRDIKDRSIRETKDSRYQHNLYGGYPGGYDYDAYTYYRHQQYYEQLRRTNPQAYAEWYRKYYGQIQNDLLANDGRESVHSGRSSANNDKDRYSFQVMQQQYFHQHSNDYQQRHFTQPLSVDSSLNSTMIAEQMLHLNGGQSTGNLSQQHFQQQQLHTGGYLLPSSARSYYSHNEFSELRSDPINTSMKLIDGASTTQDPQRLTPCKFTNEHSIVSLVNGLVVCVKPKYSQNGITNVVKVLKIAPNDSTRRLFNSFPGPLIRGITHKKTIIEFCEDQIRLGPPSMVLRSRNNSVSSICSTGQVNRASFTLMWALLILLLRQNGMVVGTDIAELLLKNKNQFPYENNSPNALKSSSTSRRNSVQSDQKKQHDNQISSDVDDDNSVEDKEEISDDTDSKRTLSELEITEKFRNYLLYGNVNEALEWATENNLWGHALFLASKVDRRSHANVMMKFANKLSLNDPLQTLYQLMSGRTPSSVTSIQDEKWGDWRPHLAMILSNTSQRPDLDRKSITTLGDSLYNRGDLFGAQFCYLMAQVGFGRYSSVNQESSFMSNSTNAVRLVLLGASHHKTFREFATNEAIMMTEIYEYACALNDDKFSLIEFQPYKYLLSLRMLDYGLQLKTLMYMEQMSQHIRLDPSKYDISFVEKVYSLSDRLKFFDPVLEKSMDDQQQNNEFNQFEDQQWLQDLRAILNDSNVATLQNIAPVGNEMPTRSQIDQQFTEINQQFSELNLQYDNFNSAPQKTYVTAQLQIALDGSGQQNSLQYQPEPVTGVESNSHPTDQYGQFYNSNQQIGGSLPIQNSMPDYSNYGQANYQQQQSYEHEQSPSLSIENQQQGQGYGYWDQQQQQQQQHSLQNETGSRPNISMPNSISKKPGFYDDSPNETNTTATSIKSNGNATSDKRVPTTKSDNKKSSSAGGGGNTSGNSGWFGGIWNKLSLKPKNQMILPDDKNPSIVWDPDKKRWVNTDGDEAGTESFKPPPKMADVVQSANYNNSSQHSGGNIVTQMPVQQSFGQSQLSYGQSDVAMISSNVPQASTSPGLISSATTNSMSASGNANAAAAASGGEKPLKTPSLQSNMFKMQRNRTLKKSYVDVFNPSGAPPSKPIEPVLAPILPSAAVPQSGLFVPAPVLNDDVAAQYQQQSQEGVPQFYNPNQFSGGYQQ